MPVKKNRPSFESGIAEWIAPLVAELDAEEGTDAPDAPTFIEDYQPFSDRSSVRVVWTKWEGLPPAERVPVVLEAYKRSKRAAELPNITSARGLTPLEARAEAAFSSASSLTNQALRLTT